MNIEELDLRARSPAALPHRITSSGAAHGRLSDSEFRRNGHLSEPEELHVVPGADASPPAAFDPAVSTTEALESAPAGDPGCYPTLGCLYRLRQIVRSRTQRPPIQPLIPVRFRGRGRV